MLMVAFLCVCLLVLIRNTPSICKLFVASNGNEWQKMLCGVVRAVKRCAELCGNKICAGFVR